MLLGGDLSIHTDQTVNTTSNLSLSYVHTRNLSGSAFVGIPPANIRYELRQHINWFNGFLNIQLAPTYTFRQSNEADVVGLSELRASQENENQLSLNEVSVFDILKPQMDIFY